MSLKNYGKRSKCDRIGRHRQYLKQEQASQTRRQAITKPSEPIDLQDYPDHAKREIYEHIQKCESGGVPLSKVYQDLANDMFTAEQIRRFYETYKQEREWIDRPQKRTPGLGPGVWRSSEPAEKPYTSDKQLQINKAIVKAASQLEDLDISGDATTRRQEIISQVPLLSEEEKDRLNMLSLEQLKHLGALGFRESNKILQEQWEQNQDRFALGAAAGQDTPEEWVLRGLHEATKRRMKIPTQGRGKHRTTSDDEKRAQGRKRSTNSRKLDCEAEKKLIAELEIIKEKVPAKRDWQAYRKEVLTQQLSCLERALTSGDTHTVKMAGELKCKLEKQLREFLA